MQTKSKPKGLAIIGREIKRPFLAYRNTLKKINTLRLADEQIRHFFGESNEISKGIDSVIRFYRWSAILGRGPARLFVSDPFPGPRHLHNYFWLFSRHLGIDLKKEIRVTDEALILDDIKLPLPPNKSDDEAMLVSELHDIVFPSYLRRKYESFDRYSIIMENHLNDYLEGPYEYGDVCLKEGDVVFDCGANKGVFSAVAGRYGARVFAFEPIPETIENYLLKTAEMNPNIRVFHYAIWDKEETLNFSLLVDHISGSRCDQLLQKSQLQEKRKQVAVPAITLDAFVEQNGIERVDFIKADIEGAERNMLRGATRILREFAPKLSICTYHLPDDPQVLRELILEANPRYQIVEKFQKMYAHVP